MLESGTPKRGLKNARSTDLCELLFDSMILETGDGTAELL